MARTVILIGATGFFGTRLAERLAAIEGIDLVLTSRDEARARAVANNIRKRSPASAASAMAFERNDRDNLDRLRQLAPWLVIDASGPFQSTDYGLAHAALEMGAHWIDLADARDYLLGFGPALDALAGQKGLVARAGASSTPALSTAVVEDLTRGWKRLDTVDIAIMPGGAGEVGEAVIRAILSYAGSTIATFGEGRPTAVMGWGSLRRFRVDGLGVRYLSPVETVDAALLPARFGLTSRIAFYAGLESRLEQFGIVGLARLKGLGLFRNLEPLALTLRSGRRVTRLFTSDRGGMTVDCAGLDAGGHQIWSRWLLLAERNEGPSVPVLPALALARALLRNELAPGAGTADVLPLASIEAEMRAPALTTSRLSIKCAERSLFAGACGDATYGQLPSALRTFHDSDGPAVWSGEADIDAATNILGRLVRTLFGFPPSGRSVPVTVTVDRRGGDEVWTRNFAGRRFASHLTHEGANVVSERFGPFKILLAINALNGEIEMPVVGWRLGRLHLPLALAPKSETREFVDGAGHFRFDVAIGLPLVGWLAHYRGWLTPAPLRVERQTSEARALLS